MCRGITELPHTPDPRRDPSDGTLDHGDLLAVPFAGPDMHVVCETFPADFRDIGVTLYPILDGARVQEVPCLIVIALVWVLFYFVGCCA